MKETPEQQAARADHYAPGDRVQSKLTGRIGIVRKWPEGRPHPEGHGEVYGAIWVYWLDTATPTHAWRHQVNRI